jgi:pSer/pThr/pTyr-binding forkhead associated (FHA) protein
MPNDINATSPTVTPSFNLGIAPNYLGVVSLVNPAGEVLRRWRLQNTKCTLGSDRQATIWLDDSKVASFHALLVLGSNNAVIKSFGPGLRLNGQPIQESALRVGDRLELLGHHFLIESLSTAAHSTRSGLRASDASSAVDSAQLQSPHTSISPDNIHLTKLEGRVDELLQRLGDIDDKITRTSAEQKSDFSRQCDSLRSETEHLRRVITQDFSSQLRHLTDDLERQNKARESRFDSKFQALSDEVKNLCSDVENNFDALQQRVDSRIEQFESLQQQSHERFAQLETLHLEASQRFEQFHQTQAELANSVSSVPANLGIGADELNSLQGRMVDLVESLQGDLQNVCDALDSKLDSVQQASNDRLGQLEAATAALSDQVQRVSEPTENTQPEIEALQTRLAQLENVLADLAATVLERRNDGPRHDNYRDFIPENQSLDTAPGVATRPFHSDTTIPFQPPVDHRTESYEEDTNRDSADEVYDRYVGALDPNSKNTESFDNKISTLLRSAEDDSSPITPIAHWSTAAEPANTEQGSEEQFEEDVSHSPLLRSLLRDEPVNHKEEAATESPMFNQKDWDESDSYLQTERAASVSALDILRASYSDSSEDQFDDEQEKKWSEKLQQFSNAIHEEPEQTLSAIGRALSAEQAEKVVEEEQLPEPEAEEVAKPEAVPAPVRLGVGSTRGRSAASSAPPAEPAAAGDDDSVEAYMQRLLARMRGDEPEESKPSLSAAPPASKASPAKSSSSKVVRNTYSPIRKTRQDPAAALIASRPKVDEDGSEIPADANDGTAEPLPEVVAPRSAPEKASDLAALRELANDSARAAVKTSDKKVKPVSNTIKLTIAGLAFAFGIVLLISNGLRVNLTLVAAATSFMLGAIWILDLVQVFVSSKKRDQSNGGVPNNLQMKIAGKK